MEPRFGKSIGKATRVVGAANALEFVPNANEPNQASMNEKQQQCGGFESVKGLRI